MVLGISSEKTSNKWILDSGATSHFVIDKLLLKNFREKLDTATIADGSKVEILGIGDCPIQLVNDEGKSRTITLTNVLFAPDLHGIFDAKKCEIYYKNQQITSAHLIDDLYYIHHEKLFSITSP